MSKGILSVPDFFDTNKVESVWKVNYEEIYGKAKAWKKQHSIEASAKDVKKVCLMPIDCQNTFCLPEFELYVGGQSGRGAIEDNKRLCEFIYKNLNYITTICPTMDTHLAFQIFHQDFWINDKGDNPKPGVTMINLADVETGIWKVNPAMSAIANGNYMGLQQHALHYVKKLTAEGKYALMIWPHHAMLGGIGHALVSSVEEACFFHCIARSSQTGFEIKGGNPLTENYSVLRAEVLEGHDGRPIAQKNSRFIEKLLTYDAIIIAGQAKSHCVSWTIADLLSEIKSQDPNLVKKVYILEDCMSPVVIPGIIDFTDMANQQFETYAKEGMNIVKSTDPIESWKGIDI